MAPKNNVLDIFQKQLAASKRVTGDAYTYATVDHDKSLRVIPIPSIALQWLINSNGWPLGRITSCAGKPKTFKSTFSYQLAAWFLQHKGFVQISDTGNKQSSKTIRDIVGNDELYEKYGEISQFQFSGIKTMGEWQAILLNAAEIRKDSYKTGADMDFPWLAIVDSLTGVDSKASADELVDNQGGVAQMRTGMLSAKMIHHFMRNTSGQLLGWPVCIHTVQQQRECTDSEPSGGVASDCFTSLDLVFTKGGISAYNSAKAEMPGAGKKGRIISIQVRSSAMGPDGRDQKISVPVLVNYCRGEDGKKRKNLFYDWGAADAQFLKERAKDVTDTMDIGVKSVRGKGDYYWSETLGISEEKKLPASIFGMVIQSNEEVMKSLRNDLYIDEHIVQPIGTWGD